MWVSRLNKPHIEGGAEMPVGSCDQWLAGHDPYHQGLVSMVCMSSDLELIKIQVIKPYIYILKSIKIQVI